MTPSEFKSWFEGFTEAMAGTPTKDQWKRIKARVSEIDGKSITERVFIDRYWHHYPYYFTTCGTISNVSGVSGVATNTAGVASSEGVSDTTYAIFNPHAAMYSLGCSEADSLAS